MQAYTILLLLVTLCHGGTCLLSSCKNPNPSGDPCEGKIAGTLVQNPNNCSQFLTCGYNIVKSCQNGLYFDNALQTCNYAQYVKCPDQ